MAVLLFPLLSPYSVSRTSFACVVPPARPINWSHCYSRIRFHQIIRKYKVQTVTCLFLFDCTSSSSSPPPPAFPPLFLQSAACPRCASPSRATRSPFVLLSGLRCCSYFRAISSFSIVSGVLCCCCFQGATTLLSQPASSSSRGPSYSHLQLSDDELPNPTPVCVCFYPSPMKWTGEATKRLQRLWGLNKF